MTAIRSKKTIATAKKAAKSKKKITAKKKRATKRIVNIVYEPEIEYHTRNNKIPDETWDFRKANTKEYTHCFHSYPAMMIPQVARRIIENFAKKSKILFDPYCGTGTSLVEANLKGISAIGTDINPLARLIATTKTTKIDLQVLDLFLQDFMNYFFAINFQIEQLKAVIIPDVKNINFWFSKNVQQKLGVLLGYIESINDSIIRNFFKVAFSETVRETSFVKQGEFNTVHEIPPQIIKPNTIDIVVTSPPYGDSRTTVAYGQYSRLANEWLGFKNANQIDNKLMGGEKRRHHHIFKSQILNDVVQTIQKEDKERARDVISFYEDYEQSINNVSTTLKKGGFACYVVGNRTVKGLNIPTDEITSQLFEENNFTHIETIVRNIPNKRMPLKNSPSNIVGETASTMKNEYIVICQKN